MYIYHLIVSVGIIHWTSLSLCVYHHGISILQFVHSSCIHWCCVRNTKAWSLCNFCGFPNFGDVCNSVVHRVVTYDYLYLVGYLLKSVVLMKILVSCNRYQFLTTHELYWNHNMVYSVEFPVLKWISWSSVKILLHISYQCVTNHFGV